MIAGLRPAADIDSKPHRPLADPLREAGIIALVVFAAALFGIFTRPAGQLAAFWPANALLLGLLVRNPRWTGPLTWLAAVIGYVAADLVTGSSPFKAALLTTGNIISVGAAYAVLRRLDAQHRKLRQPLSVLLLSAAAGAAASGTIGAIAQPVLFGGDVIHGWLFWFISELADYLAILPVVLTAPDFPWVAAERRRGRWTLRLAWIAPALAFVLSAALAVLVGGPGAVAIPVPALLWCALTYNLFGTALLTLVFGAWSLIAISTGLLSVADDVHAMPTLLSIRLGVMLITLAPITTASVMAARNELLQRLKYIAEHDPLTGTLTRSAFHEQAGALLQQLAEDHRPVGVLMLDLDHFKAVNDTYGHAGGDQVLAAFARSVSGSLRSSDAFGRVGGEEFAILLPDCDRAEAAAIAERILSAFAETVVELEDGREASATVSIGAAYVVQAPASLDALLLVADHALYQAKANGRNRIASEIIETL